MATLKEYYDAYQRIAKVDLQKTFELNKFRRMTPFKTHLKISSQSTVLEVGCGRGEILNRLNGYRVGVDIGLPYLEKFKGNYERVHALIESLPFRPQTFDMVIADSVLEHVLDLDACMAELTRVCSGYIYALVPFNENLDHYDDQYGVREHQRTFHNGKIPRTETVQQDYILPVDYPPHLLFKGIAKLVRAIDVWSVLFMDWLALKVWHMKPAFLMVKLKPFEGPGK